MTHTTSLFQTTIVMQSKVNSKKEAQFALTSVNCCDCEVKESDIATSHSLLITSIHSLVITFYINLYVA
jgi:hypothetical protein